jgi:hypothetical protein
VQAKRSGSLRDRHGSRTSLSTTESKADSSTNPTVALSHADDKAQALGTHTVPFAISDAIPHELQECKESTGVFGSWVPVVQIVPWEKSVQGLVLF